MFIFKIIILYAFFAILFISCDPEFCSSHKVINNSGKKISIFSYQNGEINSRRSIIDLENGKNFKFETNCYKGEKGTPGLSFSSDSVIIYFNDNLRGVLFKAPYIDHGALFGNKNFVIHPEAWNQVRKSKNLYYYEYEFTIWHYQKALEAYGYAIE